MDVIVIGPLPRYSSTNIQPLDPRTIPWRLSDTSPPRKPPRASGPISRGSRSKGHEVPNFLRVLAHSPEVLEGFLALNGALNQIELDPKLRELAYIQASEINGCGYCLQHHKKAGQKAGLDERQVNETESYETSDVYDELQHDVLQYAEEVTRNVIVSDELIDRLKQKLSDRRARRARRDRRPRQFHQPDQRDPPARAAVSLGAADRTCQPSVRSGFRCEDRVDHEPERIDERTGRVLGAARPPRAAGARACWSRRPRRRPSITR